MNKRDTAIASVKQWLGEPMQPDSDEVMAAMAEGLVDQLIRDGIINLSYAGDPDIGEVLDAFQREMGTTNTIRTDRFAAGRLAKRHGVKYVIGVIEELARRKRDKFAPTVNNMTQLEQKWPQVARFVQTRGGDETDL